jgi:hypothetical protein
MQQLSGLETARGRRIEASQDRVDAFVRDIRDFRDD